MFLVKHTCGERRGCARCFWNGYVLAACIAYILASLHKCV